MRFIVPIIGSEDGVHQLAHAVETNSINPHVNRRKLRVYFKAQGVHHKDLRMVMTAMGFVGKALKGRADL